MTFKDELMVYMSDYHAQTLIEFLISFALWNILNLIVMNLKLNDGHLKRADWLDFRNRIVSIIHGVLVLVLSTYNTFFVHSGCGEASTRLENVIMIIANGYFAYDFAAMAYLGILDMSMTIHHSICLAGLSACLYLGSSGDVLVSSIFLSEISNPSMHTRNMLRLVGYRYTKAYEAAEVSYMILYIFGRLFSGLPLLYRTWICDANHIVVKLMGTTLVVYSVKFMIQMVSILRARANEYAERKSKQVKMKWLKPLTNEEISKIDLYNKKKGKKAA